MYMIRFAVTNAESSLMIKRGKEIPLIDNIHASRTHLHYKYMIVYDVEYL